MNVLLVSQTKNRGVIDVPHLMLQGALTQPFLSVYSDSNDESMDEQ